MPTPPPPAPDPAAPPPQPAAALPPATAPALVTAITQNSDKVDLVLTPQDLGRLRFEVTQTGEHIRIHLTVERPETLDLLRRNADQLVSEFRQAGYSGATLSFAQGGQGGQQNAPATPAPPAPTPSNQPPEPKPPQPMPPLQTQGGGLDLRL